jgi:hypothetical protein
MGINAAAGLSGTAGDVSTMLFGSASGGLSSKLAGGNFWEGAAIGLTVSGLNHVAHRVMEPKNGELYLFQDTERVEGYGHSGLGGKLADSGERAYRLVSKDGRIDTDGNAITGGTSEVTNEYYSSYDAMVSSDKVSGHYNKVMTISKLTYRQVAKALNVAYQSAQTDYHFITANCFHIVHDALTSIGLYGGGKLTIIPNTGFYNIYHYYTDGQYSRIINGMSPATW